MKEQKISGLIFNQKGKFVPGVVSYRNGLITDIVEKEMSYTDNYIIPGLVDIHFHGCAGYDFCDGTNEAMKAIAEYELSHGITSICPATMTLPEETLMKICICAAASGLEILRGINLEGPFLSEAKKGAQNKAYLRKPDGKMLERLDEVSGGLVKLVAIAPEIEGAMECIREYSDKFRFSVAHTTANYEIAAQAMKEGAEHVTHLFNAMPPFAHRDPGVVGAAFDNEKVEVEMIADGIHIHPSMIRAAFKLFGADRVILISDSMMATGMEDGTYALGGQPVTVQGNLATLKDGTIAGSVTNLYDCMCFAIRNGVPMEEALKAATINPARSIGIDKLYGSIAVGKRADMLVVNKDLKLLDVIHENMS